MGTRAQQLALYVIFQTPFQMVSDSPQSYAGAAGVPVHQGRARLLG